MCGNKDLWNCFVILRKIKRFVCVLLHSLARDELERFIYKDVHQLILGIMDEVGGDLTVKEEGKEFVARFYTLSLCPLSYIG